MVEARRYTDRFEALGGDTESADVAARAVWAWTAGRSTFVPGAECGLEAGSLFVGADTLLGPIQLGWGFAEGGRSRVYLSIGTSYF